MTANKKLILVSMPSILPATSGVVLERYATDEPARHLLGRVLGLFVELLATRAPSLTVGELQRVPFRITGLMEHEANAVFDYLLMYGRSRMPFPRWMTFRVGVLERLGPQEQVLSFELTSV